VGPDDDLVDLDEAMQSLKLAEKELRNLKIDLPDIDVIVKKALSEAKMELAFAEADKALAKVNRREVEKALKQARREIQQIDYKKIQAEMQRAKAEMSRINMDAVRKELDQARQHLELVKAFRKELQQDGLLQQPTSTFEWKGDDLYINNVKQEDAISRKYRTYKSLGKLTLEKKPRVQL
jgi:uncharacterized membrane protein